MVAVDKIGVRAGAEPGEQRMRRSAASSSFHPICGIFSAGSRGSIGDDLAADPAEAVGRLELAPALGHQLHADANAEKRAGADHDRLVQRRFETRNGSQTAPAIGERADPGKDDAVRARRPLSGAARHLDLGRDFVLRRRALERLRGRAQIARAVIDDRNDHGRLPPRTPLVEGMAPARRGSISTAWRKARARPLKQRFDDVVIVLAVEILDMQGHPGRLGKGLKPFLEQLGVHLAELWPAEGDLPDQIGPVRGVEADAGQGLVHRDDRMRRSARCRRGCRGRATPPRRRRCRYPRWCGGSRCADRPSASQRDVDQAVPGELLQHMVEKADAGRDLGRAGAVEIDAAGDPGFLGVAFDLATRTSTLLDRPRLRRRPCNNILARGCHSAAPTPRQRSRLIPRASLGPTSRLGMDQVRQ